MAVRPIDANELYRIEKLLDTDIVRQDKVALNLLEQVLYDIQHVPTLTPPDEPLTDAGVLVPCMCGRTPKEHGPEDWKPTFYDPDSGGDPVSIECECGVNFSIGSYDYYETRLAWNTRAPILSAEEMEMQDAKD